MELQQDFDSLFRQYYAKLCLFAHQFVTDIDDCHDVVSAAFEDVWRNRATLELSTARQYLYASVRNRCIDFLRQQGKRELYVRYVKLLSESSVLQPATLEQQDNSLIVQKAIATLPQPTRDILLACYLDGLKYSEVATQMGISIATVKKHMVRALRTLREYKNRIKA